MALGNVYCAGCHTHETDKLPMQACDDCGDWHHIACICRLAGAPEPDDGEAYGEDENGNWICPRCLVIDASPGLVEAARQLQQQAGCDLATYALKAVGRESNAVASQYLFFLAALLPANAAQTTTAAERCIVSVLRRLVNAALLPPGAATVRSSQSQVLAALTDERHSLTHRPRARPADGVVSLLARVVRVVSSVPLLSRKSITHTDNTDLPERVLIAAAKHLLVEGKRLEWAAEFATLSVKEPNALELAVFECILRDLLARVVISFTRDALARHANAEADTRKAQAFRPSISGTASKKKPASSAGKKKPPGGVGPTGLTPPKKKKDSGGATEDERVSGRPQRKQIKRKL